MTHRAAFVAAMLILVCGSTIGCSDHDKADATATLRVYANLTSTRPSPTGSTTFHEPLGQHAMLAVRSDGARVEAITDQDGMAQLHLAPGEYEVTMPLSGCVTKHVILGPGEVFHLRFTCLAP